MSKIKSEGNQLFSVPNNDEGRLFLKMLSKFKNHKKNCSFKYRGRGSRKWNQRECPISASNWIAVYFYDKATVDMWFNHCQKLHSQMAEVLKENEALKEQLAKKSENNNAVVNIITPKNVLFKITEV